jgi:hypothetical protein
VFDDTRLDDPEALEAVDDALRSVAGWGAQVRQAQLTAEPALDHLTDVLASRPRAVVAAGPDGRLLRSVLEPVCPVPFVAWPHPGLPGWAGPLDLVVVLSTTGRSEADERTVAEAVRRGCDLLVTAPADSPLDRTRSGRGVLLPSGSADPLAVCVPVLQALHRLALGPDVSAEPVADALDEVAVRCGPSVPVDANPAKELALVLAEHVPVVWGGSPLAGRAARRMAEGLRGATGVPAVAGEATQLVPLLAAAGEPDLFADPFDEDSRAGHRPTRPALVVLDDGRTEPAAAHARTRLEQVASQHDVRVHVVTADSGPDVARFASLLAVGRFAARYLQVGQQGTAAGGSDPG